MPSRAGRHGGMVSGQDEVAEFAGLLRQFKERTDRSYGSLARRLGMNTSTLHRYCAGDAVPQDFAPVERFAAVADALAASGYAIVLTGAAEEAELAAELTRRMHAAAVNLCGKTSLGGLARLIQRARLIVCNDTGVSHVAAAVGTPSVVVCCGADPLRWAPLDAVKHRVLHLPLDCRPCMHAVCPIGHACALGITPDRVVEEALGLLRSRVRTGAAQEALQ